MTSASPLAAIWNDIAPHLDRALDMESTERANYLADLASTQPLIARELVALLKKRELIDSEGFLERPALLAAEDAIEAGRRVGAYTIRELIGRGGMGEVWLGVRSDGRFEGKCAIKFLDSPYLSPNIKERFHREGTVLARLTHPHIARLLDAGTTEEGRAYLALEYVDGERIDRYCANLPIDARVRLFMDVVAAVAHAHSQLIIHRDLKPSNVLVTRDGQVKLLDFGIAKILTHDSQEDGALTRLGDAVMTPDFAAPEQLMGEVPTTATDVYQLGMLLYVLLTGQHPLPSSISTTERLRLVLDDAIRRASDTVSDATRAALQGDLDAILAMALRKDPAERYPTAQALKDELARYLDHEPVLARRGATLYRARKFIRRHRVAIGVSTVALIGICAALVFAILQGREAALQRDAARRELDRANASTDFLTYMLSVAAPGEKRFSAAELLAQSAGLIDKQFPGDDPLKAELLNTVGTQYVQQQQFSAGMPVLERAFAIAERSGDPALIARSGCMLALMKIFADEVDEAERLITRASATLPDREEYRIPRAECLTHRSEFGYVNGDGAAMIRYATEALSLLKDPSQASVIRRIDAQSALAYGYYLSRRNDEAEAEFARVMAALEATGRERTLLAVDTLNNWSLVHYRGDVRKAEPLMRRSYEIAQSIAGEEGASPGNTFNYAGILFRLGRYHEAIPHFEEAIRAAKKRTVVRLEVDATMELADTYTSLAQFEKADSLLRSIEEHPNAPKFGSLRRAQLAYYRGHLAEARRDTVRARTFYDESSALFDQSIEKIVMNVGALCGLARTELANGNIEPASRAAERARELTKTFVDADTPSDLVGSLLLVLGDIERAKGDGEASARSYAAARRNLEQTLGPDHQLTQEAIRKSAG